MAAHFGEHKGEDSNTGAFFVSATTQQQIDARALADCLHLGEGDHPLFDNFLAHNLVVLGCDQQQVVHHRGAEPTRPAAASSSANRAADCSLKFTGLTHNLGQL